MASRFFAIGILAVSAVAVAVAVSVSVSAAEAGAAITTLWYGHLRPYSSPGSAHLQAFGSRSAQQRRSPAGTKFDAALADLSRHAALARPDHALEDLRSMSPAVRFIQPTGAAPLVLIDAVTLGDPLRLRAALVALGPAVCYRCSQ